MEVALLFACLTWAVLAPNPSYWLRAYFGAQIAYLPAVWAAYYLTGGRGMAYWWVYALFTCVILIIVLRIALDEMQGRFWATFRWAGLITLGTAILAALDARQDANSAIQLIEALILVFSASVLGYTAKPGQRAVPLSLCALWFCQAALRLGFVMNAPESAWLHANRWVPPALMCVGASWLGVVLRWPDTNWEHVT